MKFLKLNEVTFTATRLMPDLVGDKMIDHGGVYIFEPGETAHPEARHVHDTDEVFIFVQGQGVIPIDGVDYPVETGDVVVVEAGEDHHTRSSEDEPLVAVWYVLAS